MLLQFVAVFPWVATSIAISAPDLVKRQASDQDVPTYRYVYEIDEGGESQGKVESKSGQIATGRYYVNADQSSTEVRYLADEWGYHPLVQYGSSDEHSASTAQFSLGKRAAELGRNTQDADWKDQFSRKSFHRRPVQLVQPYHFEDEPLISGFKSDSATSIDDSTSISKANDANGSNMPPLERDNEKLAQVTEELDFSENYPASSIGRIFETVASRSQSIEAIPEEDIRENIGDLSVPISEDLLLVQNAGNYGQRVPATSGKAVNLKHTEYIASSGRPAFSEKDSLYERAGKDTNEKRDRQKPDAAFSTHTRKDGAEEKPNRGSHGRRLSGFAKTMTTNGAFYDDHLFSSTTSTPLDPNNKIESLLASSSIDKDEQSNYEYSNAIDSGNQTQVSDPRTQNNGLDIEDASNSPSTIENFDSATSVYNQNVSDTTKRSFPASPQENSSGQLGSVGFARVTSESFAKPIIVAEILNYEASQYSPSLKNAGQDEGSNAGKSSYRGDRNSLEADTVIVTPKPPRQERITLSSLVLNPIQAGVALVNAEESHLIGGESAQSPAAVKEEVIENGPSRSITDDGSIGKETQELGYEKVNPAFGEEEGKDNATTSNFDPEIEIQKSVEVYHNAPVQEIHYPFQLVPPVAHIDHRKEQGYFNLAGSQNTEEFQMKNKPSVSRVSVEVNHNAAYPNVIQVEDGGNRQQVLTHGKSFIVYSGGSNVPRGPISPLQEIPTNDAQRFFFPVQIQAGRYNAYPQLRHKGQFQTVYNVPNNQRNNLANEDQASIVDTYQRANLQNVFGDLTRPKDAINPQDNAPATGEQAGGVQEDFVRSNVAQPIRIIVDEVENDQGIRSGQLQPPEAAQLLDQKPINEIDEKGEPMLPKAYRGGLAHGYETSNEKVNQGNAYLVEGNAITEKKVQAGLLQVHPIDNIIQKTLHLPQLHPLEIEKIIERNVPFTVEKVIEKKVPVPHPYPVPIQVDRVIEKHITVPQPYAVHIKVPQPYPVEKIVEKRVPYPVEKIVEKPVPIPIAVEKVIEKKIRIPQPYPVEVEKIVERKIPYPVKVTRYVEKPYHMPYGVDYGLSYQQIMKPQMRNLYTGYEVKSPIPLYGFSAGDKKQASQNATQDFPGHVYRKPGMGYPEARSNANGQANYEQLLNLKKLIHQGLSKELGAHLASIALSTPNAYSTNNYSSLHRRHAFHRTSSKDGPWTDEYVGLIPPQQRAPPTNQNQDQVSVGPRSKAPIYLTAATRLPTLVTTSRRIRQPEAHSQVGTGSFRQSKMEYGFKPPMVPSVQYDEKTASKVES